MAKLIYDNTYWNHKGKHPKLQEKLARMIPDSGEVANADNNPALEKLRRATNCYYDLYNNGLCNRAQEFADIFGFNGLGELTKEIVNATEKAMNKLILAAAKEQGIVEEYREG